MIALPSQSITDIQTISRAEYPREAVFGILPDKTVVAFKNIHPDPNNNFTIDSSEFYNLNCIALVHSHTNIAQAHPSVYIDPRGPSEADIEMWKRMGSDVPFGILALDDSNILPIVWLFDYNANIIGQEYISVINDCHSIVLRYYWQKFGIKLPVHTHGPTWFETEPDLYSKCFKEYGFESVGTDPGRLKEGDLVLIRLWHSTPTHGAIYIGNGKILHHLSNRLSTVDDIEKWSKRICNIVRYKYHNE